jgi:hypothetical protein
MTRGADMLLPESPVFRDGNDSTGARHHSQVKQLESHCKEPERTVGALSKDELNDTTLKWRPADQ